MRTDEKGNLITLEQDINRIWSLHGWKVIEEIVSGNTWEITAKAIKSSNPSLNNDFKKVCSICNNPLSEGNKGKDISGLYFCTYCETMSKPIIKS